jgi:hypothetical protein
MSFLPFCFTVCILLNFRGIADFHTVKGVRGKVSFDSQNDKYATQLSCDASPEAFLSLRVTVKPICHLVNEI